MSTIKTVAARAGVSVKTVSRYLNAPESLSPRMRARVAVAAEELNFVPDQLARAMRSGRSGVVGLLTDVAASTPASVDVVRGVEEALAERGISLLIGGMSSGSDRVQLIRRSFRAVRAEGVIYAANYHREIEDFEPLPIPGVLVNCFSRGRDMPTVVPDDEGGGHAAGTHLIALGHRRMAYLTLSPEVEATRLRLAGLIAAHREAGISVPERLAQPGQSRAGAFVPEEAFVAALALLSPKDRPTAVFCGNDEMAMQVYNAAAQLGLSLPQDLSVVGFDDHKPFSEGLRPTLTTVGLPYVRMGRLAVDFLFDPPAGRDSRRVECPLIVRQSTAAPGRG